MRPEPALPRLADLGGDLLATSATQRRLTLARPLLLLGAYVLAYATGLYALCPLIVFLIFVAVVTSTHDVVHGALGLSRRETDFWLVVLGGVLLASGHSYRMTHLQHHRVFPGPDDPEGDPARMTIWESIWRAPLFLPTLWLWSYRRAGRRERRFLVGEAAIAGSLLLAGALLAPWTYGVLVYATMVHVGAWVFPLLTVHLPHRHYGSTPLQQTHTLRGRLIPALFLELTYHLEHHLYPAVPSHHLATLSRRLEPTLQAAGVRPWRVP